MASLDVSRLKSSSLQLSSRKVEMPDGIVYMWWDCPNCQTKKIRGDHDKCPSCGKDRTVQCYIIEGEGEITDATEIAEAHKGPDWTCGACGAVNDADDTNCRQCGTDKGGGTAHAQIQYAPGEIPTATDQPQRHEETTHDGRLSTYSPIESYQTPSASSQTYEDEPRQIDLSRFVKPAGYMLLIAAVLFGVWFLFIRRVETTVTVNGFTWSRTVNIEKYSWVAESNLTGFPSGSRNQRQNWEVVGHHQELDHYETRYRTVYDTVQDGETCSYRDLGNGRAERSCSPNYRTVSRQEPYQEAVYRTVADYGWRYYYEIQRWIHSRTPQTSGNDREVYWPEFTLATENDPEREAGRNEVYVIHYVDKDNKEYTRQVSYDEWIDYNQNATYVLTLNGVGTILDIRRQGE